jgi:protein-S-isoprenylcysteine O-methyltransferase Ste14
MQKYQPDSPFLQTPLPETRMEMTDDLARTVLLIGCAVLMPIGAYHRLRAATDERLDRRQEGWPILIGLRLFALASTAGLIAFLIEPASMAWSSIPLPSLARWSGVVFGTAAGGLAFWTFRALGHNLTDTVVTRRDATLVTSGPYRYIRHPFYLAFALAVLANALLTANAYMALTSATAFLLIVARTSIEERKLVERFGASYEAYMQRTGRFLPRFW